MGKILVICPTVRDFRELSYKNIKKDHEIFFHNYDARALERIICEGIGWLTETFDPQKIINIMREICYTHNIDAVLSTEDYPGSIFSSIVAQQAGLIGPSPQVILQCQHKYYARCAQREFVPEATTDFCLIDPYNFNKTNLPISLPLFIKPIKAFFSVFANQTDTKKELKRCVSECRLPGEFLDQFNWFLKNYSSYDIRTDYLIAETLLTGVQVTLEGYMFNGTFGLMGIVDSHMHPGTICFERFEYPSRLPEEIQKRMIHISKTLIKGIGFDNSFFNIEFMYNAKTGSIGIIEINPRMASSFADIYQKVDGTNSYEIALSIALGKKPAHLKNMGKYKIACCFAMRVFSDMLIKQVPNKHDLERILNQFDDTRIQLFLKEGTRLSQDFNDGKSYRYGYINIGAQDRKELHEKYEAIKKQLGIVLQPI